MTQHRPLSNEETDITKAVFSEGEWHIVPAEHVNSWVRVDRVSIIVHQCSLWKNVPTKEGFYWKQYGYWTTAEHVKAPCKLCMQRPPASIVHLFMLHNFDTFASDDIMGRSFSNVMHRAFEEFDRMMFITGISYLDSNSSLKSFKELGPDE